MRQKKHKPMPVVRMETISIEGYEYLLIVVRKDATSFVVDNAMQYLVYKVPAYENWVTDDELEDYGKLQAYLERAEGSEQWRNSGCKLPDGKWKCLGKADKNGFDNYVLEAGLNPETTLMLQKICKS